MAKALIVGTSNCILHGSLGAAVEACFGRENVTNFSFGNTSGTVLAICAQLQGIDFSSFDYVFLDLITNETALEADLRWPFYCDLARFMYELLPPGPAYIFVQFFPLVEIFGGSRLETIHRALALQYGVTFISLRQILLQACVENAMPPRFAYREGDNWHFRPELVFPLMQYFIETHAPNLPRQTRDSRISPDDYFVFDPTTAGNSVERGTSWHKARFAAFAEGERLSLPNGILLGFDVCESTCSAVARFDGATPFQKYLSFKSEVPYLKPASFVISALLSGEASVTFTRDIDRTIPLDWTFGALGLDVPRTGNAEVGRFYLLRRPVRDILRDRAAEPPAPLATLPRYDAELAKRAVGLVKELLA